MNAVELGLQLWIVILHPRNPPQHFREVQRFDADAGMLHQFFAEAHGIKRGGPRADHADAGIVRPLTMRHVAANILKSFRNESAFGATVCWLVSVKRMPYCQRLLQTEILPQKLSRLPPISIR